MTPPSKGLVVAGLLTIYLIWGSTYLAIRIAVETLPPFLMSGARFLVAGLLIGTVLVAMGRFKATAAQWYWNAAIGFMLLLGGNGLVSWAEQTVPSSIATLIIAFSPVSMVVAEWLIHRWSRGKLGATPNRLIVIGLVLGTLGLIVLVAPSVISEETGGYSPVRLLAIVVACLSWTVGSMMTRYAKEPIDPFSGAAIQLLCGGIWLILFGSLIGEWNGFDWNRASVRSLTAWFYLVTAGSLIGFTTFVWLMKNVSPTLVSTYAYVNPVVAVILGWLILHETINETTLIAAATIVGGVVLITIGKRG